jgi:hypothetical protein
MRIRGIDVEGDRNGRRAELTRDGANVIAVIRQKGEGVVGSPHIVGHTQEENLRELARIVQRELDGHTGTNSMVEDYHRLIMRLAE